jgi:hypothetical protein
MPSWKKIKQLRFDELRVRGSQKYAALAERRGWSDLAKLPDDAQLLSLLDAGTIGRQMPSGADLLDYFRSRRKPKFFAGFNEKAATVAELRHRWPQVEREQIAAADRIVAGQFDLLGLRGLSFGAPIDWHLEPTSGKRTPLTHWSRLDYLDVDVAGDKKIVWELNRHQYFLTLGQAYWLTGDERYAQTFVAQLESWLDQNPPKLGINWASSLEVAFRSISWIWSFYFFQDSPSFSAQTFTRALRFLYLHARHLETYLSTYFSPNTHLTGEALGLFYLGLLLPEFKDAARWRETGEKILLQQLPIHVRPDGVYFEQASYYHRYTTDFYTHFVILSSANHRTTDGGVVEKLTALLDHLLYLTRPDGTTPLFGDDDGGRLVILDQRPANDFRATLSTAAALFERPDYKFVSGSAAVETLWLMGVNGLQILDQVVPAEPTKESIAFENSGYYVMRDDWTTKGNYLLFDCGPHGQANCGHAHADALAFELAANGRTLLVDPGTFTYTGAKELRDWFRSSAAHNTLTIDGRSSSISAGPFSWNTIARCQPLSWISRDRFDYVSGTHDGYASLPAAAFHERSILFLKHDYWIIRDQLKSTAAHNADLWFHFDPQTDPLIEVIGEETFIAETMGDSGLDLHTFAGKGRWRREEGWVSHCYAQRNAARIYRFSASLGPERAALTFALPRTAGARWSVRAIEAVGGRAFELSNENWLDLVMIRDNEKVETAQFASDFEWTWARFARTEGTIPEEVVLINGQNLLFKGRRLLQGPQHTRYSCLRRMQDKFRVEGDGTDREISFPPNLVT